MQIIDEMRRDPETGELRRLRDMLVGAESPALADAFKQRSDEARQRLASGEAESITIHEARRIGRNDPCPCGSGYKFKRCCGVGFKDGDERLKD